MVKHICPNVHVYKVNILECELHMGDGVGGRAALRQTISLTYKYSTANHQIKCEFLKYENTKLY